MNMRIPLLSEMDLPLSLDDNQDDDDDELILHKSIIVWFYISINKYQSVFMEIIPKEY